LIFNQGPEAVLQWADVVARWEFQRIIPCHLEAPIVADGADFRRAFTFLEAAAGVAEDLPAEDFDLLRRINRGLTKRGIMPAAPEQG
jgi:hypothetical protein